MKLIQHIDTALTKCAEDRLSLYEDRERLRSHVSTAAAKHALVGSLLGGTAGALIHKKDRVLGAALGIGAGHIGGVLHHALVNRKKIKELIEVQNKLRGHHGS